MNQPTASFFDRFTERQMALFVIAFGLLLYLPLAEVVANKKQLDLSLLDLARALAT